jgi:hypothetical protein
MQVLDDRQGFDEHSYESVFFQLSTIEKLVALSKKVDRGEANEEEL